MSVLYYSFHPLPLKLSNKIMNFLFFPLKLSNKIMEEYSKIILFISFSPPKRGLNEKQSKLEKKNFTDETTRAVVEPNWEYTSNICLFLR